MTRRPILALALAPLLLATAAAAQPPAPPHGPHGAPSAEMTARHEAMQKQHIEDLKTVLRLRPDQEAALTAFVASHRHRIERKAAPRPDGKPPTTPERLERMDRMHSEMATRHARARDGLTRFYAALSPEQQKVFDALQRLKGPHGGGHGGKRVHVMRHGPGGPDGGHGPRHERPR